MKLISRLKLVLKLGVKEIRNLLDLNVKVIPQTLLLAKLESGHATNLRAPSQALLLMMMAKAAYFVRFLGLFLAGKREEEE